MSQMSEERRNLIKIQIREDLEKAKETLNKNGKEES
jgi:nitrogen fixation protein NifB